MDKVSPSAKAGADRFISVMEDLRSYLTVFPEVRKQISNSEVVAELVRPLLLDHKGQEAFYIIAIDIQWHMIGEPDRVFIGTADEVVCHPRDVFRKLIEKNATSFIVVHNHLTQEVTPSKEDIEITRQLIKCGSLMSIALVDHLIVSESNANHYSLRQHKAQLFEARWDD